MPMQRAIPPEEADQISRSMVIPARPTVLEAVQKMRDEDDPDFSAISALISEDISLSAAMLKTVNSPFFQLPHKIGSVDQALQILGLRNASQIMEGLLLRQTLGTHNSQQMESFWNTSSRVALISRTIATQTHGIAPEKAYSFGLFHNAGQVVMWARFRSYGETMAIGERMSRQEYIALEEKRHQTSHNVVGYLLARTWYLPPEMQLAVLNHHYYNIFEMAEDGEWHDVCTLVAIGSLAEHIHKINYSQYEHPEWRNIEPILLEHLALKEEEYEDILDLSCRYI